MKTSKVKEVKVVDGGYLTNENLSPLKSSLIGQSGVYCIMNPSFEIYVGASKNLFRRLKEHSRENVKGNSFKLEQSFLKHGKKNHRFYVFELCNEDQVLERERFYQEKYNSVIEGLNGTASAIGGFNKIECPTTIKNREKGYSRNRGRKNTWWKKAVNSRRRNGKMSLSEETKSLISNLAKERYKSRPPENSKLVVNLETGIFYTSIKEAAEYNNINYSTLKNYLKGRCKNKTNISIV